MIVAVVIYGACYPAAKYIYPCALRLSWAAICDPGGAAPKARLSGGRQNAGCSAPSPR